MLIKYKLTSDLVSSSLARQIKSESLIKAYTSCFTNHKDSLT